MVCHPLCSARAQPPANHPRHACWLHHWLSGGGLCCCSTGRRRSIGVVMTVDTVPAAKVPTAYGQLSGSCRCTASLMTVRELQSRPRLAMKTGADLASASGFQMRNFSESQCDSVTRTRAMFHGAVMAPSIAPDTKLLINGLSGMRGSSTTRMPPYTPPRVKYMPAPHGHMPSVWALAMPFL